MSTQDFPHLASFLAAYLNEDWDLEYGTLGQAVGRFRADASPQQIQGVATDIHAAVNSANTNEELGDLLTSLGSGVGPAASTPRALVDLILSQLGAESDDAPDATVPVPLPRLEIAVDESATDLTSVSGQGTARLALRILQERGYIVPSAPARRNVAMSFAGADKVVYGKAFDALRIDGESDLDLDDLAEVTANLGRLRLYEVKSTKREMRADFVGHFFSLSTAELLVAQSLGHQFAFVFVNVQTSDVLELSLPQLYAKAKAIYPGWSVRF